MFTGSRNIFWGTSLGVQCLRLHTPSAGGPGSTLGRETINRSHMPQLRPSTAKQINIFKKERKKRNICGGSYIPLALLWVLQIARCKDVVQNLIGKRPSSEKLRPRESRTSSRSPRLLVEELGLKPRSAGSCLVLLSTLGLKYSEANGLNYPGNAYKCKNKWTTKLASQKEFSSPTHAF